MTDEYITVEEAASLLRVSIRQANRYGSGDNPRIRTRKAGKRILYHRGDVEALANDLGVAYKPIAKQQPVELLPPGDVLNLVRDLQERLMLTTRRIGELEALLQHRLLPEDADELQRKLTEAELLLKYRPSFEEVDELRRQLAQAEAERDILRAQLQQSWETSRSHS